MFVDFFGIFLVKCWHRRRWLMCDFLCFCLTLKGFRQSKQAVFCLKCRAKTNLAGRQLDDLGTNHYVLRLIDAGAKLQQLQADSTK